MNSVALNGAGLDSLVAMLADSLGAGRSSRTGASGSWPRPVTAPRVLDPGHCHATRQALRRTSSLQVPVRLESGNRPARLVVPVVAGGDLLAYLTVAAPAEGTDRVEEVQRVANAMAVELEVERRLSEILDQDEEEFFADLVAGAAAAPDHPARFASFGYNLAGEHIPLAFILSGRGDPVSPREGLERLSELVHSWAGQEQLGSTPIVGLDDEAVIVFLPTLDRHKALTLAHEALNGARRRGIYAVAGTGPVCHQPEDYGAAADKAKWAARVRLIAGHTEMVASFDEELGVGALLFKIDDRAHLEEFVGRWLGDLKEYDKRHQSQLTMSLRVLLENVLAADVGCRPSCAHVNAQVPGEADQRDPRRRLPGAGDVLQPAGGAADRRDPRRPALEAPSPAGVTERELAQSQPVREARAPGWTCSRDLHEPWEGVAQNIRRRPSACAARAVIADIARSVHTPCERVTRDSDRRRGWSPGWRRHTLSADSAGRRVTCR